MKLTGVFPLILIVWIFSGCTNPEDKKVIDKSVPLQETEAVSVTYPEEVRFPSADSLPVTGHWYEKEKDSPVIVLCHQARFNKYEYAGIAEELNSLGYSCLAIDQRSGGPIANHLNETYLAAKSMGKLTGFLDAEQDIYAAINYAHKRSGHSVILWGSSYSATLGLYIAAESEKVSSVVSFSPGNYLAEQKGSLTPIMKNMEKPFFLTSSRTEIKNIQELVGAKVFSDHQMWYRPSHSGHHGSRALWPSQDGGEAYWEAIREFLKRLPK